MKTLYIEKDTNQVFENREDLIEYLSDESDYIPFDDLDYCIYEVQVVNEFTVDRELKLTSIYA